MTLLHVFVETNFLFGAFRMPSKRHQDALSLKARFDAGEVNFYVPHLCFQEARHLIARNLPGNRCADLLEFHRFADRMGAANWDFGEIKKFLEAATAEVNRTKAVYQRELVEFATALGDNVLHGTNALFGLLESLELDDDNLKYNDRLILSSVLLKARELQAGGEHLLYFASVDKSDLQPTSHRPRMSRYYHESGLTFVPGFVLPDNLPAPT